MADAKDLVFGVEVAAMYDGYVALEVIVLVKSLDEDGDERWISRCSDGVGDAERYGILTFEAARIKDYQVRNFERTDGPDDDGD